MNEAIFLLQIVAILFSVWGSFRMGKEALVAFCILQSVLANLFVLKQTLLFGWNVTCSDAFAIGSILSLNLIQQTHGPLLAKKTVQICLFGMFFFVAISQVHLLFEPSHYDVSHDHFKVVLDPAPRLLLASVVTFFLVQRLDVALFGYSQKRWKEATWKIRSTLCLCISQAIDTVLFSFLGLYGVVQELGPIIVVSYLVKCVVIGVTALGTRWLDPVPSKRAEL